jgi:lysophospholipase L1-like esterase
MKHHRLILKILALVLMVGPGAGCHPQVQTQFVTHTDKSAEADPPSTVLVLGSSMAAGWVTSYRARHDLQNGYAARLGRLLATRGDTLINHSIPGNTSADILGRMDEHIKVADPDFVLIGLSLGNEKLDEDRDAAVAAYSANLPKIIESCRLDGRIPVVGLCYPYDRYDANDYAYLKRMNLTIDGWGVPAINFLGAVDDGTGHFVEGYTFDEGHPDNRGHEEMFLVIVPSLFDALREDKPAPKRPGSPGHTTVKRGKQTSTPVSYIPDDPIHSFSVGFSFRTKDAGVLAAIDTGDGFATLALDQRGRPVYTPGGSSGAGIDGTTGLADGVWHDVVLAHRYLQGKTLLFVDGRLVGETEEQVEPRRLVLGGSGVSDADAPSKTDYRDWLVYRAALDDNTVEYLHRGGLFAASMEVYAPLDDEKLKIDRVLENRAWSTSRAASMPADAAGDIAALERKYEAARVARENEFVAEEKTVVAVAPEVLESYAGKYEIAPGDLVEVVAENGHLYMIDRGERIELFAQSAETFFIKTVGEITITFEKDDNGVVSRMVLGANGREIPAKRID